MINTNKINEITITADDFQAILYFHNIKQKEIAKILDVSDSSITLFLKGKRNLSNYRKMQLIEKYFKPFPIKYNLAKLSINERRAIDMSKNFSQLIYHSDVDFFIYNDNLVDPLSYFYFLKTYDKLGNYPNIPNLNDTIFAIINLQHKIYNDITPFPIEFKDKEQIIKKTLWINPIRYKNLQEITQSEEQSKEHYYQEWLTAYWWWYSVQSKLELSNRSEVHGISIGKNEPFSLIIPLKSKKGNPKEEIQ